MFVRHGKGDYKHGATHSDQSPLWNTINITTLEADISWSIRDQPTCASALVNRTNYACVSTNSKCMDDDLAAGYICSCDGGYQGNSYIIDGCLRDTGNLICCKNYTMIPFSFVRIKMTFQKEGTGRFFWNVVKLVIKLNYVAIKNIQI